MISARDLQQSTIFMHADELYEVEDANAQIKDAQSGLWIPCVIYTEKKVERIWEYQRFIRTVPDFMRAFSLPEEVKSE